MNNEMTRYSLTYTIKREVAGRYNMDFYTVAEVLASLKAMARNNPFDPPHDFLELTGPDGMEKL